MELLMFCVLCYFGDKANRYLKYHILGVRAEIYADAGNYFLSRMMWGLFLGLLTIPLALLHKLIFNRS